jgi:AmmeMemoRadiSam system protein B
MIPNLVPSEIRRPVVAGAFYPSEAQELESTVEAMLSQTTERRELSGLCGLVVPHAGYPYSGPIAGAAFSLLAHSNDAPNRILLIGPPHYVPVRGIVAPSSSAFATPLGDIAVDVGAVEALRDAGLVTIDDTPHTPEHALEVELPFLQRVLEDFTIVPLLVDAASPEQVALVIETMLGKRTLLVVSTDLSHYLDYATAQRRDLATAETIERLDYTTLGPNDACGFSSLNGALCAASRCSWTVTRLDLRNSGDTTGEKRRVVGYGAWAFTAVERQEHC